jgi:hypothetical protein
MMDENGAPTFFVGVIKNSPGLTLNKESQYGRMERP